MTTPQREGPAAEPARDETRPRRRYAGLRREDLAQAAAGRQAERPLEVPRRGWKDILLQVGREVGEDQLSLVAAGVAFYFMLSLFPGLLALVAIYGVLADPATVGHQIGQLMTMMPGPAAQIVADQLREITTMTGAKAGYGAALALVVSLWTASNGTEALIAGLNIAYDEQERRGYIRLRAVAIALTAAFILVVTITLAAIAGLPALVKYLPLGRAGTTVTLIGTWLLIAVLVMGAFSAIYRLGPSRERARWQWVSVGSATAAGLWLLASLGFSWYAAHFNSFNKTYGTLAGAILLLLWLQITAFVTLIGAELNAEIEYPTARDKTTGRELSRGRRAAAIADNAGEVAEDPERRDDHRRRFEQWRRSKRS